MQISLETDSVLLMDLVRGQPNIPTRPINVVDSLEELDALAVIGMGLLQAVIMLGTMIVTYKIPGHEKVR